MQNYSLTGDTDRALAANMFANLQNSSSTFDPASTKSSEALILSLLQGGAGASPSNNPDVAGRINMIAALQNSGGADPTALYKQVAGNLTRDYTPIKAQGRIFSRSDDPIKAIRGLQNDPDFLSLPHEFQDKVVETRGGAQALTMTKLMRGLAAARASQSQRIALKNEEEAADALQSPQRMIKRMYESGELMHDPEKGLLMKQKDAAGVETFGPANPWILGLAADNAPRLGYGDVKLNPAQAYARELHRTHPDMSITQIHEEVGKKFPKKAEQKGFFGRMFSGNAPVAGAPANGVVPGAAPTPFDPRRAGANTAAAAGRFIQGSREIKEEIPAFVLAILQNLKGLGSNAASGVINMGAGAMGSERDVMPYYPETYKAEAATQIPDWLKTISRNNPFLP